MKRYIIIQFICVALFNIVSASNSLAEDVKGCKRPPSPEGLKALKLSIGKQLVIYDKVHYRQMRNVADDVLDGDVDQMVSDMAGMNPNVPLQLAGPSDMSLLELSAVACRLDVAKKLIELGASVDGGSGASPMTAAVVHGDQEMLKLLLKQGAKMDKVDHSGITPLELAVRLRHLDTTKLLLDAGGNVNARLAQGGTLLDIVGNSSTPENKAIADELVRRGGISGLNADAHGRVSR